METPTPTRRGLLRATGTAALALTATALVPETARADLPADLGGERRADQLPETVALPDGLQPEGITSGPGTTFYVGSLADGRIVTGDLRGGGTRVLLPGAEGRAVRGLFWDARTRLVWAVGQVGAVGHLWAVEDRRGRVVTDVVVPGAVFLNDLVVTPDRVWVTDSQVVPDRLTSLRLDRAGRPAGAAPEFLTLAGDWPAGNGADNNANGIRRLRDGSLLLDNARVGGLWRVDPADGVTRRVPVLGGPDLTGGDGLLVEGSTVYVVRGSGQAEVSVLRLRRTRGAGWAAQRTGSRTAASLDVPSTATVAGGALWAVNARFGVADPTTAGYVVTRLPR